MTILLTISKAEKTLERIAEKQNPKPGKLEATRAFEVVKIGRFHAIEFFNGRGESLKTIGMKRFGGISAVRVAGLRDSGRRRMNFLNEGLIGFDLSGIASEPSAL